MKIVIMGPRNTGTIFHKLCFDSPPPEQNVGFDYAKINIILSNKAYQVTLWDIAGYELDSALMKVYLRDSLGVFMVCDTTNKGSFDEIV
jgi:GTPase SAR1 family protein